MTPLPLPLGALFIVSPAPGDDRFHTPMEWMAHKWAGCVGVVVDVYVSAECHPAGIRVPLLVGGAVWPFDRRHLLPVVESGE